MSISNTVKSIQDIMRKDAGVDGDAQRIAQLGWMLFVKIFDDREQETHEIQQHTQNERFPWPGGNAVTPLETNSSSNHPQSS